AGLHSGNQGGSASAIPCNRRRGSPFAQCRNAQFRSRSPARNPARRRRSARQSVGLHRWFSRPDSRPGGRTRTLNTQFDIVVIGAGIAGASIAAELAPHANVALLEAEDHPGYHSTGRSAAFWAETYGGPKVQP